MLSRATNILYRAVPSALLIGLVLASAHGGDSILRYWELRQTATESLDAWAQQERQNTRMLLQIRQLDSDPVNVERLIAEELGMAREGATLYHFDEHGVIAEPVAATP
jgi:cell division protein FtsB